MGTSGARPQCQPTSRCHCALCTIVLYASVKGALTAPYFLVAHARRPSVYVSSAGPFLHFSVIIVEKTGSRERRGFESLPCTPIAIKLSSLFFSPPQTRVRRPRGLLGRTHVPRHSCRELAYLTEISVTGVSEFLQIPRPARRMLG